MKYLGAETWDDVLAQFGDSGKYAGQWGWLEVLHHAQINDQVEFLTFSGKQGEGNWQATYRGRFTKDDNGDLLLTDKYGTGYDAGAIYNSYSHDLLQLFRDSPPGASVTVQNNWVGQWQANQKYLHVSNVDLDALTNPIEWIDQVIEPALLGGAMTVGGAGMVMGGAALCVSVAGCVAGGALVLGGVGMAGSGIVFIGFGAYRADYIFRESIEWAP